MAPSTDRRLKTSLNGLFIVPTDLDDLHAKGVADMLHERSEGGFLSRVVTVHPFARSDRTVALADDHLLVEFAPRISGGWRPLRWLRLAAHLLSVVRACAALVRSEDLDFVRAQDPYYCGFVGWLVARITGRPFCVSIHADYDKMHALDPGSGAPKLFGSRGLARMVERMWLSRADLVLAISEYIASYAKSRGARPSRVRIFRHIVHMDIFSPVAPEEKAETLELPIVGVVSRLSTQKYIHDVISIAAALRRHGSTFRLEIAGDGEERDSMERRIASEGLAGCVFLLGFVGPNAVADLHRRSAIHLSLICGSSLIEAAAAGVCIVGYDVEWQSELIRDGDSGALVPAGDWQAAALTVARLLDAPTERERLADGALRAARLMFDPQALIEARRAVYRELTAGASSTRRSRLRLNSNDKRPQA